MAGLNYNGAPIAGATLPRAVVRVEVTSTGALSAPAEVSIDGTTIAATGASAPAPGGGYVAPVDIDLSTAPPGPAVITHRVRSASNGQWYPASDNITIAPPPPTAVGREVKVFLVPRAEFDQRTAAKTWPADGNLYLPEPDAN